MTQDLSYLKKVGEINGNFWEIVCQISEYDKRKYYTWRLLKNGRSAPLEIDSVKQKIPKQVIDAAYFYNSGLNDAMGYTLPC